MLGFGEMLGLPPCSTFGGGGGVGGADFVVGERICDESGEFYFLDGRRESTVLREKDSKANYVA